MPYLCSYAFCEHTNKLIPLDNAVACSKCGNKKHFHRDCFDKHNNEKHSGKAIQKPLKEISYPKPRKA